MSKKTAPSDAYLSKKEVMRVYKISDSTIRRLKKNNKVRMIPVGDSANPKCHLYHVADIEQAVAKYEEGYKIDCVTIGYVRVCPDTDDAYMQRKLLRVYYPMMETIVVDTGNAADYNRPCLRRLLDTLATGQYRRLVVTSVAALFPMTGAALAHTMKLMDVELVAIMPWDKLLPEERDIAVQHICDATDETATLASRRLAVEQEVARPSAGVYPHMQPVHRDDGGDDNADDEGCGGKAEGGASRDCLTAVISNPSRDAVARPISALSKWFTKKPGPPPPSANAGGHRQVAKGRPTVEKK